MGSADTAQLGRLQFKWENSAMWYFAEPRLSIFFLARNYRYFTAFSPWFQIIESTFNCDVPFRWYSVKWLYSSLLYRFTVYHKRNNRYLFP